MPAKSLSSLHPWRSTTRNLKAFWISYGTTWSLICFLVFAGTVLGGEMDGESEGIRVKRMTQTNVRGLHVCRSQGKYICCPGWKPNPGSGMCLTAVCRGSCGDGVCSAPNTCTRCQQTPYGTRVCQRTAPAYTSSSYPVNSYTQTQHAALNRQTSRTVSAPRYVQGYQTRPSYSTGTSHSCSTMGCRYSCGTTATGGLSCTCPPGYMLGGDRRSCRDVDECSRYSSLCQQVCRNTLGGYKCACNSGQLQSNRRTCSDGGCSTCAGGMSPPGPVTLPGSSTCPAGYQLQRTSHGVRCVDINECQSSQCDQDCVNTEGGMRCECGAGFTLSSDGQGCTDIDECARSDWQPCHHTCVNSRGSFRCSCQPGFYLHQNGRSCLDVNECNQGGGEVCHHVCRNTHGSYQCDCRPGFELQPDGTTCRDIDECSLESNGCIGSCINTIGSYQCSCTEGYTSRSGACIDVDECLTNNGGCEQLCVNTHSSFLCSCHQGYTLNSDARTCTDVDECNQFGGRVCEHGCENIDGTYQCTCPTGLRLHANKQNCVDINECMEQHGVCHYRCINTRGSYNCICPPSFQLAADGRMCDDIDECAASNHGCQGGCENTMGSYHCTCSEGQLGTGDLYCGKQQTGCTSDTCSHKCVETGTGHNCLCSRGYQLHSGGRNCEDKNECLEVGKGGCQHLCINTMGSYYCTCYAGYRLHYDRKQCVPNQGCNTCTICPAGFHVNTRTGRCEDVDECTAPPGMCGSTRCSPTRAVCSHNCINTVGSYSCTCRPGYLIQPDGYTCSQDGPLCSPPCRNGGSCRYSRQCGGNTYNCRFTECACVAGFTGPRCENSLPTSCQPPCMNGGQCVDGRCQCTAGFTGPSCTSDKNECATHQCEHHCQNTFGSFQCLCRRGYTINPDGETCSEIGCFPPCMNGATCNNKVCVCPEGYSGPNCQLDINECAVDNGGCEYICRNTYGSYVCFCPRGATLAPDNHSCSGVTCNPPCNNNGTCVNRRCICPSGFTGPTCLQDINECARDNPCAYQCLNTYGGFECVCPDGSELRNDKRSCHGVSECLPDCQNGGTCQGGECVCTKGFTGQACTIDIDECENETLCAFQCNNYYGGFECLCPRGYMLGADNRKCVDIDECLTTAFCEHECANTPGSYRCTCPENQRLAPNGISCLDIPCIPACQFGRCQAGECRCGIGYTGIDCSIPLQCDQPCANGGNCVRGVCQCAQGYSGEFCQTKVCRPLCINRGMCVEGVCVCPDTHTGEFCQHKTCKSECLNGGTCSNDGVCICEGGFTGEICQIKLCRPDCQNGVCINGECLCNRGYKGQDCSERECQIPCQNLGTCVNGTCACLRGFTGLYCEQRDCDRPCLNGGVCELGRCTCPPSHTGEYCQTEVCPQPCLHGGVCDNGVCICIPGYSGNQCQDRVCILPCQNGGVCVEGICQCLYGFIGVYCEITFGNCEDLHCLNGGYCSSGRCVCTEGFNGPTCSEPIRNDGCVPACLNGGSCQDSVCHCTEQFYGTYCKHSNVSPLIRNIHIYQTGGNNFEGSTVDFICETNSTLVEGTPLWYYPRSRGGQIEFAGQAQGRFSQQILYPNTAYLVIRDLHLDDIDSYRCAVPGGPSVSLSLIVTPLYCEPICLNGGTCHADMCMCPPGYTGVACETKVSYYCPVRCLNGGYCSNGTCVCQEGFLGSFCQIAVGDEYIIRISIPSDQRPTVGTTISIVCEVFESPSALASPRGQPLIAQWEIPEQSRLLPGVLVDGVIDATSGDVTVKAISPSASLLTITNFQPAYTGSYNCTTGTRIITYDLRMECIPPCMNDGACLNGKCQCHPGYSGDFCEMQPPEMSNKDCRYACANNGTCINGICLCLNGFQGDRCEIDFRALCGCLNGGTCEQGACICPPGFSGALCQDGGGFCFPPCQNGGTCLNGNCYCDLGFVGFYCEIRDCTSPCYHGDCVEGVCLCDEGFTGEQCDLLDCALDCLNGSICFNGTCACLQGFTGVQCDQPDCYFPCLNGATCVDRVCQCTLGFTGDQCDELDCILPCINGDCVEGECVCQPGFEGEQCDQRICRPACVNNGQCQDGTCVCPRGYAGPSCENQVPYIEIIPEQSVIRYGTQLSWRCIYHLGSEALFWQNPSQRFIQLAQEPGRGDLGFNNVFTERIAPMEMRLVIVDFQPGFAGNYSCGTFIEREYIMIEATLTTTASPTTPSVTVTIPSNQPSNCVPFNSSFCRGLPYQNAIFPTSFAQNSETAELLASAMYTRLSDCNETRKVVLCFLFFQPCDSNSDPSNHLCQETCLNVQHECKAYMQVVLEFLSAPQAEQFLGVCSDLQSQDVHQSCVKNLKKPPTGISKCDGMCKNGGTCINDQCICKPGFTGEMCEYPVDTLFEYDVVITPVPPGYPEVDTNLTVVCEIINNNVLVFPVWFGPDDQNILSKQPDNGNQRVYMESHSQTASKLIILGVRPSDQGTYQCIVGQQSVPHTVILQFPDCNTKPCLNGGDCINGRCHCPLGFHGSSCEDGDLNYVITITPEIFDLPVIGSNLTFLCGVSGLYPSNPVWLNPTSAHIPTLAEGGMSRVFVEEISPTETNLNLINIQPQDSGVYVCVVDKLYSYINISVQFPEPDCLLPCLNGGICVFGQCQCPPNFRGSRCQSLAPPSYTLVITPAPDQTPVQGGTLSFLCEMTQESDIHFPFWVAPDGQPIFAESAESNDGVYVVLLGTTANRLVITNLNERKEGIYKCISGSVEASINITVFEPQCERPCFYGSACINGTCLCPYGLEGEFCQNQTPGTECELPCANNGLCVNNQCFCQENYLGELCQIFVGGTFNITVVSIDDVVPVTGHDVQIVCAVEGDGVFPPPMWINPDGFTIPQIGQGGSPHMNVDSPVPGTTVLNINDISTDDTGTYTCVVGPYVNTYIFRIAVSDCDYPCANGGQCVEGLCLCPVGYTGRFCEVYIPVPACELPCQNEGTCVDGICRCPLGFTNPACSVKVGSGYFLYLVPNLQRPPIIGEDLTVICEYVGNQRTSRPWWSDENRLRIPTNEGGLQRVYIQNLNATATQLIIKSVKPSDIGRYTCSVGVVSNTFTVTITEPECTPVCQNGGVCNLDGCQCTEDYTGVFCQTPVSKSFGTLSPSTSGMLLLLFSGNVFKHSCSHNSRLCLCVSEYFVECLYFERRTCTVKRHYNEQLAVVNIIFASQFLYKTY